MEENYRIDRELAALLKREVDHYNRGKWGKARCCLSREGVCFLCGNEEQKREFAGRIAAMLTERGLLLIAKEYISRSLPYLRGEEVGYLGRVVNSYFVHYTAKDASTYQKELSARLLSCLLERDTFNILGFVQFRMQDYLKQIGLCLQDAVDGMMRRYENELYVECLRKIIEEKGETGFPVYLHFSSLGEVRVLDGEGRRVVMAAAEEEKALASGLNREDIALCCLLALNPERIRLMNDPGTLCAGFYSLLCDVFGSRVIPYGEEC